MSSFMMTLQSISETIDGLPNFCGEEEQLEAVASHRDPVFLNRTPFRLERLQSAFGIALHMHQPLILEDGDIRTAPMINNLKYMMDRQHIHGNQDAPVFAWCYSRIADFIRELVDAGRHPRVMLDYSGCLLFGLRQMGRGDILDNLKTVVHNDRYWPCVEWLGCCVRIHQSSARMRVSVAGRAGAHGRGNERPGPGRTLFAAPAHRQEF